MESEMSVGWDEGTPHEWENEKIRQNDEDVESRSEFRREIDKDLREPIS